MLQVDAFIESPGTEAVIAPEGSGVDGHCVLPEVPLVFLLLRDKAEGWRGDSFIIGGGFCITLAQGSLVDPGGNCSSAGLCCARECCQDWSF